MATIKELQEKIAKLEKGINSKATNTNAKAKARLLVKKFKSDIAELKAKSKPTTSKVSKAKEISKEIKRKYSKSRPFGKSDIYQDAVRPAKRIGKRTSAEGNTYYEYRENRTDRKQPPKKYPRLEDGGSIDDKNKKIMEAYREEISDLRRQSYPQMSISEARKIASEYMLFNYSKEDLMKAIKSDKQIEFMGTEKSWINALNKAKKREYADGGEVGNWYKEGSDKWGLEKSDTFIKENNGRYDVHLRTFNNKTNKWGYRVHSFDTLQEAKEDGYSDSIYADGGALNLLADTSGAGLQNVGGSSFSNVDLTPQMDITNPFFANGGELHRSQDGMYAMGGILEHGLKVGDKIIDVSEINSSSIRVMNDGKYAYVNLSTGERREGTM